MAQHIVDLEGPDVAGHYAYRCTCGANASGYEPDEVIAEAEAHGHLAANQSALLAQIRADIAANIF